MLIARSAVKAYLNKLCDSWEWLKELDIKTLQKEVDLITDGFAFKTPFWKQQLVYFICGYYCRNFLFLSGVGTGKTKITLDLISYYKDIGAVNKSLVVVERSLHIDEWLDLIQEHSFLSAVGIEGTQEKREKLLNQDVDVYVLSYSALLAILSDLVKVKDKDKRKRQLNLKRVKNFSENFDLVMFDETHNFKNDKSLTYKVCNKLSDNIQYRYGGTGTAWEKDRYEEIFPQFSIIDKGETYEKDRGWLDAVYFDVEYNRFGTATRTFKKGMKKEFFKRMQHRSLVYSEAEFKGMPKRVDSVIRIELSEEAGNYYDSVLNKSLDIFKSSEVENIYLKLRQITAGFLYVSDQSGSRSTIHFKNNKLEALLSLVSRIPENKKMLIFVEFIETGNIIVKALKEVGISCESIYGQVKNKSEAKDNFKKNDVRCLVASTKTLSSGINLQYVCHYLIYYETTNRTIIRNQSEGRIIRAGQEKTVYVYDFVAKNTVDEKVLKGIQLGYDYLKDLMSGKAKLKDLRRTG